MASPARTRRDARMPRREGAIQAAPRRGRNLPMQAGFRLGIPVGNSSASVRSPSAMIRRVILVALGLALTATGRADTLTGAVTDEAGAPLSGVEVALFDPSGAPVHLVGNFTDSGGRYVVNVPAGAYDVEYRLPLTAAWASREVRNVIVAGAIPRPSLVLPAGVTVGGSVVDG